MQQSLSTTNEICTIQVIIPIYKDLLTHYERLSLKSGFDKFSKYTKVLVKPLGLNTSEIENEFEFDKIEEFDPIYFKGREGYNKLMLSTEFYERFLDSTYLLILQLDVFVFNNELPMWIEKNFDYVGAPWVSGSSISKNLHAVKMLIGKIFSNKHVIFKFQTRDRVGNGGFSLRKVRSHYDATIKLKAVIDFYIQNLGVHNYNEDVFWSMEPVRCGLDFKIPSMQEALPFAFDTNPAKMYVLNNKKLPMACHGWFSRKHIEFWSKIIEVDVN